MKYDVFISYARKDFDEVSSFVEMLKERIPRLTYWFDITGIESGDEFEEKIITAIDNSSYVLFALSDNSIQSQWAKDEVMYAKNTDKKVIPLLLKGATLKGWFLFKFGRVDCIDTTNRLQTDKLVRNLCSWKGISLSELEKKANPQKQTKLSTAEDRPIKNNQDYTHIPTKINGHEYVDLGLPSGLKWATMNVGASEPEECGDYFAWGEVKTRNSYGPKEDSATYGKDIDDISGNVIYDVSKARWGASWRLPKMFECQELIEKCTWIWDEKLSGVIAKGPNGNKIFFPAAGYRDLYNLNSRDFGGFYWSSTPNEDNIFCSYSLLFNEDEAYVNECYRTWGYCVRPVSE